MIYPKLWADDVESRVRREAINLDNQERHSDCVRMCARCVMTNQRPRIVFDDEGVCSACRYADRKKNDIDWVSRKIELKKLLGSSQKEFGYDVIVPASGGKDSSFVAWTLAKRFQMRPLLARWAPHIATDIGESNWQALLHSGFDGVTAQPNGLLHRKLSRLALEFYGDPFLPFIYGQLAWPFHVAVQNGVNLVFFGENGEAEYGGDPSANDKPCWSDSDWERVYMKGASVDRLLNIGVELGAIGHLEALSASPFYRLPNVNDRPEFHWLGYYLPWAPQANYYHAAENTGFEPNTVRNEGTFSRYASIDDKLDGWHYRFGFLKFGIGRCTSDASHEVRDGELTREEAISLVVKYDSERPSSHLDECLDYLGMDDEWMSAVEERFTWK